MNDEMPLVVVSLAGAPRFPSGIRLSRSGFATGRFVWLLFLAGAAWPGLLCAAALAEGVPKIQFEQTAFDFGHTSLVASVSGVFKFKNVGDGVLKIALSESSCAELAAAAKTETFAPGAGGEIPFTLNLEAYRGNSAKHISVRSNDPLSPEVSLTIQADYTPLYEVAPRIISPSLAFGKNETVTIITITRMDGAPLRIARLEGSQSWIRATVLPGGPTDQSVRIFVATKREGSPRRFDECVSVYTADQPTLPVTSLCLCGEVMGEVSLMPRTLSWRIAKPEKTGAKCPAALVRQHAMIRLASGRCVELKNPRSSIKEITVELLPQDAGKAYELVARLEDIPAMTVSGNVSFETSVADQPRIEMPVVVTVSNP